MQIWISAYECGLYADRLSVALIRTDLFALHLRVQVNLTQISLIVLPDIQFFFFFPVEDAADSSVHLFAYPVLLPSP